MDEVELIVGTKNLSYAVEAVSLCDIMCQLCSIWMPVIRPDPDVEGVGEDFFSFAGGEEEGGGGEDEEE